MGGEIPVSCPSCRAEGKVPLTFSGKEIRCKKCGSQFFVEGPSFVEALCDDAELAPLDPEEESHCRERYEARVLSKNRSELHHDEHGHPSPARSGIMASPARSGVMASPATSGITASPARSAVAAPPVKSAVHKS